MLGSTQQVISAVGTSQCFCCCVGPDEGHMMGCENLTCKYQCMVPSLRAQDKVENGIVWILGNSRQKGARQER